MPDDSKAVFLSYASQDAEAARRICEALRAGGVEVWFDADGGLEHGDEWDAKIRKQIKECVLFIPIISANTQARLEGYFRLEWELAAQRAMSIASGVPFILPVVIDETREPEALVPDRFRMVQWTKLPGGVVTPEVQARYLKLWSHRTGVLKATELQFARARSMEHGESAASASPGKAGRRFPAGLWIGAVLAAIVLIGFFAFRLLPRTGAGLRPANTEKAPPLSEAQQLVARARELTSKMDYTRADLEMAEGFARKATELDQGLAEAWGVRAFVNAGYLVRGFTVGDEKNQRAKDAQTYANRALVINPDEPDALIALGKVLTGSVSEALLQRAVTKNPENLRAALARGEDLRAKGRLEEAQAVFEEAVRRHPTSVGAHYDLSGNYLRMGNLAKAWDEIVAAVELQPFMRGLVVKAYLAGVWKGDLPMMRATLEQIAPADRTEDRAVYMTMWCGLLERRSERVLEAAAQTSRDYLIDATGFYTGPKASLIATAHLLDGRENLARQQWQSAEALLRRRLQQDPQNLEDRLMLATTLVWLGQEDEARQLAAPVELAWQEQLSRRRGELLAEHYAVRRDGEKVVHYLRAVANERTPIRVTKVGLRLDPCWDRVRGQPAFAALLADEQGAEKAGGSRGSETGTVAPEKSVAVLAFANLSDDKANEYFSDGISEELINALGRVPGLKVPARTSSFHFKGKNVPVPEIARQLGVAYVIEGSVQRAGEKVKISARLSKAADGFQVWADSFLRDAKDIFAVQDEIARAIAQKFQLAVAVPTATARTVNPDAMEFYLRGRQAWALRTRDNVKKAEDLLQRAIALQPDFARAHAGLADVWMTLAELDGLERYKNRTSPDWDRIVAKLDEASALDPNSAESLATRGQMANLRWQFAEAERLFRRALELNPNYASAHQWYARHLTLQGRMDEALVQIEAALAADPFAPRIASNAAMILVMAGRPTKGLELAERSLALQSGNGQGRIWKAQALVALNRVNDLVEFVRTWTDDDGASVRSLGPSFLAEVGRRDLIVGEFRPTGLETAGYVATTSYNFTRANLILGRKSEALAALVPAEASYANCEWMAYLPLFDQIRSEPAFRQFYQAVGLAEAHTRVQAWRAAHPPEIIEAKK